MMYAQQRSKYSGKTFMARIPEGWVLNPPDLSDDQIVLTREQFSATKKRPIIAMILDGHRCMLYEKI